MQSVYDRKTINKSTVIKCSPRNHAKAQGFKPINYVFARDHACDATDAEKEWEGGEGEAASSRRSRGQPRWRAGREALLDRHVGSLGDEAAVTAVT